jgi:hypothetical protein
MANPIDVVAKLNEIFEDEGRTFVVEDLKDFFYLEGESVEDYSLEDAVYDVLEQIEEFEGWVAYAESGAYEDLPE